MDVTPKLQRKTSLSLSTRLKQKRLSESPKNRFKLNSTGNTREVDPYCGNLQRSPSIFSDGGIECTPPNKKFVANLDESIEYSPKVLDSSFSPTCLMSQTLAIDSPEVGWKWSRNSAIDGGSVKCVIENGSTHTPDSAYAADSSYASAGSSSIGIIGNQRTGSDSSKLRTKIDARRDHRKFLEKEIRRVEKTKAEEKLKQRCAKLQEQLKCAGTQKLMKNHRLDDDCSKVPSKRISFHDVEMKSQAVNFSTPEKRKNPELLNDFFNDSDSDCFLLEATQDIESKIESKIPATISNLATTLKTPNSTESTSLPVVNTAPAAPSSPPMSKTIPRMKSMPSPNEENKEKRSSFYMKFLEDDCSDWFESLDEVIIQATQNKKPRMSLQRYKSMPTETAVNSNTSSNSNCKRDNITTDSKINSLKPLQTLSDDTATSSTGLSTIKRHSSTHALSSTVTNYRSRRQL